MPLQNWFKADNLHDVGIFWKHRTVRPPPYSTPPPPPPPRCPSSAIGRTDSLPGFVTKRSFQVSQQQPFQLQRRRRRAAPTSGQGVTAVFLPRRRTRTSVRRPSPTLVGRPRGGRRPIAALPPPPDQKGIAARRNLQSTDRERLERKERGNELLDTRLAILSDGRSDVIPSDQLTESDSDILQDDFAAADAH